MENYLAQGLSNITLTVLQGRVVFEPEVVPMLNGHSYILETGDSVKVDSGLFHSVLVIEDSPAFYMYTFFNSTRKSLQKEKIKPMLPIFQELSTRFHDIKRFGIVVLKCIYRIVFGCHYC